MNFKKRFIPRCTVLCCLYTILYVPTISGGSPTPFLEFTTNLIFCTCKEVFILRISVGSWVVLGVKEMSQVTTQRDIRTYQNSSRPIYNGERAADISSNLFKVSQSCQSFLITGTVSVMPYTHSHVISSNYFCFFSFLKRKVSFLQYIVMMLK